MNATEIVPHDDLYAAKLAALKASHYTHLLLNGDSSHGAKLSA